MGDDQQSASELTHYRLTGTRMSPKRTRVDTGSAEFVVGRDGNPVEYFLGGVVACVNSTGTMVARDMDIDIRELDIVVEGDVNYARYRGEESTDRPGLQGLEVSLSVESDADEATLAEWIEAIEARCPVTDTVENETAISVSLARD